MRLLSLAGAAGLTAVGAAHAMTLEAQQSAARAAAFSPAKSATLAPIGAAPARGFNAYPVVDADSARSAPTFSTPSEATPALPAPMLSPPAGAAATPEWLTQSRAVGLRAGDAWTLSTVSQRAVPGAVLGEPDAQTLQPVAYDLSYTRAWPSAFSMSAGKYGLEFSPHATLGAGASGRSAGAGVEARFGKRFANDLAQKLGVKDSSAFGDRGRWYLFAASDGTAVGFNMMHRNGDWSRAGFSEDATSALIGDTQAGIGWRKGSMQASMGYVHREVKIRQGATDGLMGAPDRNDNLVALSFSIKPQH